MKQPKGMLNRKGALLICLQKVMEKHDKHYCWPSHVTLLDHLKRYHGVEISESTLCRDLKELEESGEIDRKRRIKKSRVTGKLLFASTLYWIRTAGRRILENFKALGRNLIDVHIRLSNPTDHFFKPLRKDLNGGPEMLNFEKLIREISQKVSLDPVSD